MLTWEKNGQKNEGLFYMKIEKKVKQPTAPAKTEMEKCSGGSEILGAHLYIFIELNIDDFPLLHCIINKNFSSKLQQNGLDQIMA